MKHSLLHRPTSALIRPGWWCVLATTSDAFRNGTDISRGRRTDTAEATMVWMRLEVRTLVSCFDPAERERTLQWLQHGQWEAVMRLKAGEDYAFVGRARDVAVTWSARPVLFLTLLNTRPCTPR
ncbi:hypothetical protein AB0J38_11490 [Streptomyces sp. NPDC050095]|uniref:hypothetical protein n=1 Tax=unclassified Streptomyces TaxID=2593676 RepID=UPI003442C23D